MENIKVVGDSMIPRFGHTITLVSRTKAVLFGGATKSKEVGKYIITNDTYIFDLALKKWSKIEPQGQIPSPRAAHSSTAVEALQLVVYGGAVGDGGLASDDLFLLDLRPGEENASYMTVPIVGTTPGRRYGHTIVFSKPHLLVFGGNVGHELVNDVWSLNVECSPFFWNRIECTGKVPDPRVYHSAAYCPAGQALGMMVIFGGRGNDFNPLNDAWGFRRHRDGKWDWARAPYRPNQQAPVSRYQHSVQFMGPLLLIIGGRTNQTGQAVPLEIYDTETSDLHRFQTIDRFRHSSWVSDKYLYIHGGFEQQSPNIPTVSTQKIDLQKLFQGHTTLLRSFSLSDSGQPYKIIPQVEGSLGLTQSPPPPSISPPSQNQQQQQNNGQQNNGQQNNALQNNGQQNNGQQNIQKKITKQKILANMNNNTKSKNNIRLSHQAVIAQVQGPNEEQILRNIPINKLQKEAIKLGIGYSDIILSPTAQYHETLYTDIITQLLKKDISMQIDIRQQQQQFAIKKDKIIKLCDEVIHLLESQSSLLRLRSPIKIYGDIHGQYLDLLRMFDITGKPTDSENGGDIERLDYLFLGNICDIGKYSLEVICLIFALKLKYPEQLHVIRGNHEERGVNRIFGLGEECIKRLNEDIMNPSSVYQAINKVFDYLPLAALIDNKIFCVHGGIGQKLQRLEDIESIERPIQLLYESDKQFSIQQQLLYDILWSDPSINEADNSIISGYSTNLERNFHKNGTIVRYSQDKINKFLQQNNLQLIIRGHECVKNGYEKFGQLITLFTCTDFCGKYKNAAALILIKKNNEIIPKVMEYSGNTHWLDLNSVNYINKKELLSLQSLLPQKPYEEEMKKKHPNPLRNTIFIHK